MVFVLFRFRVSPAPPAGFRPLSARGRCLHAAACGGLIGFVLSSGSGATWRREGTVGAGDRLAARRRGAGQSSKPSCPPGGCAGRGAERRTETKAGRAGAVPAGGLSPLQTGGRGGRAALTAFMGRPAARVWAGCLAASSGRGCDARGRPPCRPQVRTKGGPPHRRWGGTGPGRLESDVTGPRRRRGARGSAAPRRSGTWRGAAAAGRGSKRQRRGRRTGQGHAGNSLCDGRRRPGRRSRNRSRGQAV